MQHWGWRVSTPGSRLLHLHYYQQAERIADAMIARFYDATNGGFFDTAQNSFRVRAPRSACGPSEAVAGFADASGEFACAMLLLRLSEMSDRNDYEKSGSIR